MGTRILVVEDEPAISELISAVLRYEGFEVVTASTGNDGVRATRAERPDLILLDVMLPDDDGFRVQERLNAERDGTPIIFLTARDTPADKIRGLTHGADDYITKPFNVDELVARVKAVLRRSGRGGETDGGVLRFADLSLDEDTREVRRGAVRIDLTPTEYTCSTTCSSTPSACSPRPRSSTTCGTTTSMVTPGWSRPTSSTSAASSMRTAHP